MADFVSNNPFTEDLDTTSMIVSRFPGTRIIVLSLQSENSMTASRCQAFACYSLCENCSPKEILAAIREGKLPKKGSASKHIGQSIRSTHRRSSHDPYFQSNPG